MDFITCAIFSVGCRIEGEAEEAHHLVEDGSGGGGGVGVSAEMYTSAYIILDWVRVRQLYPISLAAMDETISNSEPWETP